MDATVRLTYLVDSPTWGGAEACLVSLLSLLPNRFRCSVVATAPVPVPLARAAAARGDLVVVPPVGTSWARVPALRRAVRATHPTLVHANLVDPYANLVLLAAATGGVRAVATLHMTGTLGPRWCRPLLPCLYRRLAAVIAVSAEIRELLVGGLDVDGRRVLVVRNGVAPFGVPDRPARPPGTPLVVGGLGRLTRQKGFDLLIEATRRLVGEGWPVEVRVAGAGRERERLAAAAAGLPVRLVGHRDDVPDWLADLDVFCLPSRAEGLPLALLEAMMAGLPCVAAAVGDVPAAVGDAALLVPPEDVSTLTATLCRLLTDAELRAELGRRARDLAVRRFDVADMVADMVAIYDSVLEERVASVR